jgi:hypothetical protein
MIKTQYTVSIDLINIHHAASTEATRPNLCGVYVDARNKRIAATDGRMLIYAPVEVDGDTSGIISTIDWTRMAADAKRNKARQLVFSLEDGKVMWEHGSGQLIDLNYPSLDCVIPADTSDEDTLLACLDPNLLMQLAKAAGGHKKSYTKGMRLCQLNSSAPFRITVGWNSEARCLLMPMRLTAKNI